MKKMARTVFILVFMFSLLSANLYAARNDAATLKETGPNGKFIANANGTVLDTSTGLMWAAKDNGESINWQDAKKFCENYRGGGYTDWWMPTIDELAGLYDKNGTGYAPECSGGTWKVHITKLIHITCCCLSASNTDGSTAAVFYFIDGVRWWHAQSSTDYGRALPVRGDN